MTTDCRRQIIIGILAAGWLALAHPVTAQEMAPQDDAPADVPAEATAQTFDNETKAPMATEQDPAPVNTETSLATDGALTGTNTPVADEPSLGDNPAPIATEQAPAPVNTETSLATDGVLTGTNTPVADEKSSGDNPAPIATQETPADANTETNAGADHASMAPAMETATAITTNQIDTASAPAPDAMRPSMTNNINPAGTNSLATTNTPPPDAPGWWFTTAQKQQGNYPAFLGVRFAKASRAIIIETPNRKLTTGEPLVYQLWVCNDLPQPVEINLEHAVWKGKDLISQTNTAGLMIKGSEARLIDRFQQNTGALEPGIYTIDATLRDQAGNLLHRMTETIELAARKSP